MVIADLNIRVFKKCGFFDYSFLLIQQGGAQEKVFIIHYKWLQPTMDSWLTSNPKFQE
jgi:hypothetical protein